MQSADVRIGVFGGTFDPPHNGHVAAVVNVRYELGLDRVLMVVNNEPWQKVGDRPITPALDRLAMVEAAVGNLEGVEPSRLEIERGGSSYMVDTLRQLASIEPTASLFLIVGADTAAGIETWDRAEELPTLAELVVVGRPDSEMPRVLGWVCHEVRIPQLKVSSTDIRDRVAKGAPLNGIVPDAVVDCISWRGLYDYM